MKKKLLTIVLAGILCATSFCGVSIKSNAEELEATVSYESLLTANALVGYTTSQTRGVYLVEGSSIINDAGGGKIGAGGITTASMACSVSVNVIVERKVNGSWVRQTSWTASKASSLFVNTGKTLSVASGYYYRVRCLHSAGTDSSSSYTGALWM